MMNAFQCFQSQQVDNLRSIDALEEEISATGVVMIYASKGYFKSKSKRGDTPRAYITRFTTAQHSAPTPTHMLAQTASAKQTRHWSKENASVSPSIWSGAAHRYPRSRPSAIRKCEMRSLGHRVRGAT